MSASSSSLPHTTTRGVAVPQVSRGPISFKAMLSAVASLKVTVVLFACSVFLVWVGTLAQVELNMWDVMQRYFRSFIAWIPFKVFFPQTFFPDWEWAHSLKGTFPFPGGFTIGTALMANLVAAHLARFRPQAKGSTLVAGALVSALGVILTAIIVMWANNANGLQGTPLLSWDAIWSLFRWGLVGLWVVSVLWLFLAPSSQRWITVSGMIASLLCGALALYLVVKGDSVRLSDASLRILWQLLQGGVAAGLLLAGCLLIFRKRAGIVVIHLGVGLVMLNELFVAVNAVEERINIAEGQTTSLARDIREVEIAIVDRATAGQDRVWAIPASRLKPGAIIDDGSLPFRVEVLEFMRNSDLRPLKEGESPRATAGVGRQFAVERRRPVSGAEASQLVDVASIVVRVGPRDGNAEPAEATYLLPQHLGDSDVLFPAAPPPQPESVVVDGRLYEMRLRYKQNRKPYAITLNDVRKDDYLGTDTPRDYSSWITLADEKRDFRRERIRIWMNNPLRYGGETFYQNGYGRRPDGTETTTLQVVTNTGWMVPYIACMYVGVGMMYHFSLTLLRFLQRPLPSRAEKAEGPQSWTVWLVPAGFLLLFASYAVSAAIPRTYEPYGMDIGGFSELPVVFGGRVKPLDTLARNSLRTVSNKQTFVAADGNREPAIRWLLDVIALEEAAWKHKVFRIDSLEVLEHVRVGTPQGLSLFGHRDPKQRRDLPKTRPRSRSASQRRHRRIDALSTPPFGGRPSDSRLHQVAGRVHAHPVSPHSHG